MYGRQIVNMRSQDRTVRRCAGQGLLAACARKIRDQPIDVRDNLPIGFFPVKLAF